MRQGAKIERHSWHSLLQLAWLIALLSGVVAALQSAWIADDAFISLRYAANAAAGEGLIFNPGLPDERVEGFTNLLWTLLLVVPHWYGIDAVWFAKGLGIASFMALLWLIHIRGHHAFYRPGELRYWFFPLMLPALALHAHMQVFATSGLETMLFTLLVTAGILYAVEEIWQEQPNWSKALPLLALASLARPDGAIFYVLTAIVLAIAQCRQCEPRLPGESITRRLGCHLRLLGRLSTQHHWGLFALIVPVTLFRWLYFGEVVPNTFYARSVGDPYPEQGRVYIGLYFAAYWLFALVPLGYLGRILFLSTRLHSKSDYLHWNRVDLYQILLIVFWLGYLLWIGGDFMFARFLIPVTPLLYLMLERNLRLAVPLLPDLPRGASRSLWAHVIAFVLAVATIARFDPYRGQPLPLLHGIAEEQSIYRPERVAELRELAGSYRPLFEEASPILAFVGSQSMLIYYLGVPVAIEVEAGLTDALIAREPLMARGRVGHERSVAIDELQRRGVTLLLRPPPEERAATAAQLQLEGFPVAFEVVTRDAAFERLLLDARVELIEP